MTLPRRSRLSGKAAFSRVFQQAEVSSGPGFKVLARRTEQPASRLGMAVSRQVDKRAVGRNRIKRIIRESFRAHYLSGPRRLGAIDVVVLPRRQAVTSSNAQLFEQLSLHWQRLDERFGMSPSSHGPGGPEASAS